MTQPRWGGRYVSRAVLAAHNTGEDGLDVGAVHSRSHDGARDDGRDGQPEPDRPAAIALGAAPDGGPCQRGGKSHHLRAARLGGPRSQREPCNADHNVRLPALFLVAAGARGRLYARPAGAAHARLCRGLHRAGHAGAGAVQVGLERTQGNSATCSSPIVSGKPSIRFMFCTAWPDAPLVRLSSAEPMMARPGMRSAATPMKVMLEPRTCRVCGVLPNGSTWTKGSFA